MISFSYLVDEKGNNKSALINDVEVQLQYNLVKKHNLARGWIGDGGDILSKGKDKNYDLHINYLVNPVKVELVSLGLKGSSPSLKKVT